MLGPTSRPVINFQIAHPRSPAVTARASFVATGTVAGDLALLLVVGVWAVIAVDDEAIQRQAGFVASGIRTVYDRLPVEQESFAVGRGGAAGSCKLVEQPCPGLR